MNSKPNKKKLGGVNQIDTRGLTIPLLVLIGVGLVGGGVYFARQRVLYLRSKKINKNALDKGTVENLAKRIQNAVGNRFDGTDEEELFTVASEIQSKDEFDKVSKAFFKLTNQVLPDVLSKELSSYHYNLITDIIGQKSSSFKSEDFKDNSASIAQKLKEAIYSGGFTDLFSATTDVDGVFEAFHLIPNKEVYQNVKAKYKELTNKELWVDLEGEWELQESAWNNIWSYFNDGSSDTFLEKLRQLAIQKFGEL